MRKNQKGEFLSSRVRYIAIGAVRPNPQQPRRSFDETALRELADSIRAYGILQPLTVRDKGGYYELVAGERRLRAARMAGLREVPCLIAAVGEEDAALLALIENLQRRDLDYLEEAAAISRLIGRYGLSQQQAAEKLGKSQPAIANKLRLLRLGPPVTDCLRQYGLTERHARGAAAAHRSGAAAGGGTAHGTAGSQRGSGGAIHRCPGPPGTGRSRCGGVPRTSSRTCGCS